MLFKIKRKEDGKIFTVYGVDLRQVEFHLVTSFLIYDNTWYWIEDDDINNFEPLINEE